jgi:VWFA-related protein
MNILRRVCLSLFLCLLVLACRAQSTTPAEATPQPGVVKGHIKLDVVVTSKDGEPVSGLDLTDFTLLDNNQPEKILSFQAIDSHAPDETIQTGRPPVEVILVLDTVNLGFQSVAYARQEVEKFLRQNGGHLAQPVSIYLFSDTGLLALAQPSNDGNALAGVVDQRSALRAIGRAQGANGAGERFQLSVQAISTIADNQKNKAGRKLLIWVGAGWPMLDGLAFNQISPEDQRGYFGAIVSLSTRLRESRIALYSISQDMTDIRTNRYQDYVKGVKSARQASPPDLALKVLATQSGGRILGPNSNLAGQIDSCVTDAKAFYAISLDPPRADGTDEYHDLKVRIGKPGLLARTSAGYYDQP